MPISATYADARANFAKLWDRLEQDRELLVIERRGHEDEGEPMDVHELARAVGLA